MGFRIFDNLLTSSLQLNAAVAGVHVEQTGYMEFRPLIISWLLHCSWTVLAGLHGEQVGRSQGVQNSAAPPILKKWKWHHIAHCINYIGCLWNSAANTRWELLHPVTSTVLSKHTFQLYSAHIKHLAPPNPQAKSFRKSKNKIRNHMVNALTV